ncbi:autophagy-related protein 22-like protein, partial [Glomus cerebriforme]
SFKRIGKTIKSAKQLVEIMKYLIAWFILSDGFGTVRTVGILFAKKILKVSQVQLLLVSLAVPICAMFGAYVFLRIQRYFNISTKRMVIMTTALLCLVPIYALFGFIAPFGFKHSWEIWLFAVYYGGLLGATQSFCTVLFSSMIPKGHENEFFSLNQITDKGSSWLGPLIVGIIDDATHDLRYSFWYLLLSIIIPLLIMLTVNVDKGRKGAELFVENETKLNEIEKENV